MLNRISVVLVVCGIVAAALVFAGQSESSNAPSGLFGDCRDEVPTPTSTGTPWGIPPYTPYSAWHICNDTAEAASDLHIVLTRPAVNDDPISVGVTGCPEPTIVYGEGGPPPAPYETIDVYWPTPCVDVGENIYFHFVADCSTPEFGCNSPPYIFCHAWTRNDAQITPTVTVPTNPRNCESADATPRPTPSPTPTPGSTCAPREAPPLPYPSHPPTPFTVGPTSRDVVLQQSIPFCNNSSVAASDLHIYMKNPYSAVEVEVNAAGCAEPTLTLDPQPWDKLILDIDWGEPCVDRNEGTLLRFTYSCGDSPCILPEVYCYTWTLNDVFLDSEAACPSPFVTASPTPTPTPGPITPTVSPPSPMWGDLLCDAALLPDDTVSLLRLVAGLSSLPHPAVAGCPEPGDTVVVNAENETWGDWNCDGDITASDALPVLLTLSGFHFPAVIGPCPQIGSAVAVGPF